MAVDECPEFHLAKNGGPKKNVKRMPYSGKHLMARGSVRKEVTVDGEPSKRWVYGMMHYENDREKMPIHLSSELDCDDGINLPTAGIWYSLNKRNRWADVAKLADVENLSDNRRRVHTTVVNVAPLSEHRLHELTNHRSIRAREWHSVNETGAVHRIGKSHGTQLCNLRSGKKEGKRCRAGKCHRIDCPYLHEKEREETTENRSETSPIQSTVDVHYHVARTEDSDNLWRNAAKKQNATNRAFSNCGYGSRRNHRARGGNVEIAHGLREAQLSVEEITLKPTDTDDVFEPEKPSTTFNLSDYANTASCKKKSAKGYLFVEQQPTNLDKASTDIIDDFVIVAGMVAEQKNDTMIMR